MATSTEKTERNKRGRKSGEEVIHQVAVALKHVQDLEELEVNPLARLPAVRELARGKYREAAVPAGSALRTLLIDSAKIVLRDLEGLPRYQRELSFLKAYVFSGSNVAEISRILGLSREHVARSIQRRTIRLVARVFLVKANHPKSDGDVNGGI
ncbi:MAG: hypothetical protein J4N90_12055 [Chloroflexi bacterium]|nr:hypothetical protein [Chloroflexota bacterium]MCI0785507.1 hypothetical protein [Chloroflexota bacterium]MCI0825476.1 hypothetical protein [Chloroflexota bacterium]